MSDNKAYLMLSYIPGQDSYTTLGGDQENVNPYIPTHTPEED